MAATDPNVIFLSLELSVVVVPFTVRFPKRVRFVAAKFPDASRATIAFVVLVLAIVLPST